MKSVKNLLLFLIFVSLMISSGCTLDFLSNDEEEEETDPDYYEWDSDNDINYYRDGETGDTLWYETYDYDGSGECILVKHYTPQDTFLWAWAYAWNENGIESRAYFNDSGEISSYDHYFYDLDGNITAQASYSGSDVVQRIRTWDYDAESNLLRTDSYDYLGDLEWSYTYEWDTAAEPLITLSTRYNELGSRSAYIEYEYSESDDSLLKKIGYGECGVSTSHSGAFSGVSLRASGGINTVDRTDPGLVTPDIPGSAPSVATAVLADTACDYTWMTLWDSSPFEGISAESRVDLNDMYLPTYMATSISGVPEVTEPLEIRLTYTANNLVDTKTTIYGGQEALVLDFDYEESGYLSRLTTTGEAMLLPVTYDFGYEDGIPKNIDISSGDQLLQKFIYIYPVDYDPADPLEFARGVHEIEHLDGDLNLVATYEFEYDEVETEITITIRNPDNSSNGHFILDYDADGLVAGFSSFDSDGGKLWEYSYSYDEFENRVSELLLDENGDLKFDESDLENVLPEVITTFDVNTILGDLARFMPGF